MKFLLALLLVFQTVLPSWGATGKVIQADKVSGTDAGKNYLAQGDAEVLITGINQYNDGSVTRPVDCTGGTGGVTMARSSTSPIEDKFSWIVTKDATNRQGQGISIDFTAPKAKAMTIAAKYLVNSGTFAAGSNGTSPTDSDLIFYVYDVTNSRLIEPSTFRLYSNQTSTDEPYSGEFQTNSDSTSYRLCLHVATTSASAWSLKLDDIEVKRSKYAAGTPITDWQSYTPTGNWSTGTATYTGRWRKVGDSIEVQAVVSLSGAPTAADFSVNIPAGLTIDVSKIPSASASMVLGSAEILDSGARIYAGTVVYAGTTSVYVNHTEAGNAGLVNATNPTTFGAADTVSLNFKVPILGWSSSVQVSDGYDGRVVSADIGLTGNQSIATTTETKLTLNKSILDRSGIADNTNSRIVIKSSGTYLISASAYFSNLTSGSVKQINIKKNTSTYLATSFSTSTVADETVTIAPKSVDLIAGDYLEVTVISTDSSYSILAFDYSTYLNVTKVPGSATISASETVSALYTGAPPTGTLSGSANTVTYGTKVNDSHGAYSGGVYTIQQSGLYDIEAVYGITGTYAAAGAASTIIIYVDSTPVMEGVAKTHAATTLTLFPQATIQGYPLRAGQTVTIKSYTEASSPSFDSFAYHNHFSISKRK